MKKLECEIYRKLYPGPHLIQKKIFKSHFNMGEI